MLIQKKMFALQYKSYDGNLAFDIFEGLDQAQKYPDEIKTFGGLYKPLYIFEAPFNADRIYKENGKWNYEDHSDTFDLGKCKIVKQLN